MTDFAILNRNTRKLLVVIHSISRLHIGASVIASTVQVCRIGGRDASSVRTKVAPVRAKFVPQPSV